jgi:RND family efflux transporter MFP subunit
VPVEVIATSRQPIAAYFETNGVLEAENEVDLVARLAGPILELLTEEGQGVSRGQLLARVDGREIEARLSASRIKLDESQLSFDRIKALHAQELVSRESFDLALSRLEGARAEVEELQIQLSYTEVRAPFGGLIVNRYIKLAQTVSVNTPLFRLSDFNPLLCPIRVPERELARLHRGQRAELTIEAFRDTRFPAEVLRLSPVVDAATGTVKVTLQVRTTGQRGIRLRPGMFASVFLEMERRQDALVIPKAALTLDSLGDSIFVVRDGVARRQDLTLGFLSDDLVEVKEGLAVGDVVVVVGQDGLSDGTPIEILTGSGAVVSKEAGSEGRRGPGGAAARAGSGPMTEERLVAIKERMRQRGLSEAQIEERLQAMRRRAGASDS